MEYQDVIEQRYSVRSFSDKEVSRPDAEAILQAGRIAPTARNNQPMRVFVATSSDDLATIDACSPCRYGAPLVLILGYSAQAAANHKDDGRGNWSYGPIDVALAWDQMACKATDLGLGTCIVGLFDEGKLRKAFNIDDDILLQGLLPVGYPALDSVPSPKHNDRLPLQETVVWL